MAVNSTLRAVFHIAMFSATSLAVFSISTAIFSQGNSGNSNGQGGGSGKPPVGSFGPVKLPMWSLNGNATDSTAIFGTTSNMPIKVVVNNIHRGSFTNTGFDIYGNSHSTSAFVDSILTSWQIMVNDVLSVTGNINAGGDIVLSANSSIRPNSTVGSNASLTFNGYGNTNTIGLGYNINSSDSAQGLVVIPHGNSQYPNGGVLLGDVNPNGEVLIALDGSSGGRLNIRGWEKKTYLINNGGEKITLDGVNGNSTWETTKGLTLATRSGTTFTDNYHLNIQGNLNSQKYYQNDTLVDLVNLQTTVANIKSTQWQNDTVNPASIFYSGGNVGIGTSEPSVPLEVSGSIKITGSDTTGSGGGGGGGGGIPPPVSRSIIIDGGLDRITATSGTLDFVNTNLTTTGSFQSSSITTANLTIIDKIESDSMHARKSLEINNSLRLKRDTSEMYAEMSTKDTAVALMLQKDPSAPVVIGDAPAPPPGESRAKLTVVGNTKLDGALNVTGNITTASNINANCVTASCLNVSGQTSFDSLRVANTITTSRISAIPGDTLIHIGDSSLTWQENAHRISTDNNKGLAIGWFNNTNIYTVKNAIAIGKYAWAQGVNTISIGNNSIASGTNSIALGNFAANANAPYSIAIGQNVQTDFSANNSIVIGNGGSGGLINDKPNSLMIGFNSNVPSLYVGSSNGTGTVGRIGIRTGINEPKTDVDIRGHINIQNGNNAAVVYFPSTGNLPNLYFRSDDDPDTYEPSSERMVIEGSGKIGIGVFDPTEKLHVEGGSVNIQGVSQGLIVDEGGNKRVGLIKYSGRPAGIWRSTGLNFEIGRVNVASLPGSPTSFITDLLIGGDGNIGIGTQNPQAKLHLNGILRIENQPPDVSRWGAWGVAMETELGYAWRTTENSSIPGKYIGFGQTTTGWYWITADKTDNTANTKYPMTLTLDACGKPTLTVQEDKWCDFVYDENYSRMTFEEQENYWKKHKHLFGIASEKDIIENGLDITGTMKGFALNIEEVRMDAVDLHKRLLLAEEKNIELREKIDSQQNQIYELKKALEKLNRMEK